MGPTNAPTNAPSNTPTNTPTNAPTAAPIDVSPNDEETCEDNSIVRFKIVKSNGKTKYTKCNKIKEKDCDTKVKCKEKVNGVKKGKPKDFCLETCNPTLCCKDGTDKYRIKNKEGEKVNGKFS